MPLTNVTVTVPEERAPDLLRYAATLCETRDDMSLEDNGRRGTRWGWGRRTVQDAYLGGSSDYWRPWCDYLAEHPDTWVAQDDIADAIELDRASVAGMLGAAERRCRQKPPYEKRWSDGRREYRMPSQVAEYIAEVGE